MSKLIECEACGTAISAGAKACPKCGAPNNYLHPRIKEFLAKKDILNTTCKFEYKGNEITFSKGNAPLWHIHRHQGKIWSFFGVCLLFNFIRWQNHLDPVVGLLLSYAQFFLGMATFWIGVIAFFIWVIRAGHKESSIYCKFDFSTVPPTIEKNHDQYWNEVITFFNGPKAKQM